MRKIIIHSSSFEEELERQHRIRLMNNLFRRANGAVYEPIYIKQTDDDKIDIQLRTAEAWGAFAVFLLGEIVGGVYVTLNYGWFPALYFLTAAFLTYTIIVFCNADNFNIKALIKCLIGISCTCLLFFLTKKIYKNIIEDDNSIRSAIAFATAIFGIASTVWSLIFCGIINEINSRLRKQKQIQIEAARRKHEAEAKAKAKAKAEEERRKREAEQAKVEEERIQQKQPEYCNYCKELINNFWNNDFFDSDEETDVLLSRLRFTLENSKYFNWKTEFYDKVVEKIKATTRPPKLPQSKQQSLATGINSSGFNMYFNGILLTLKQYQILIRYPQVKDLYNEDLFAFCCMLAKKTPEFANFKQTDLDEVQEAYNFMGMEYKDLSKESLKKAYRRLYLQYLPDWNKSANAEEIFSKLQKSHEILQKELQLKYLKTY